MARRGSTWEQIRADEARVIVGLIDAGETATVIARRVGRTPKTVRNVAERAGRQLAGSRRAQRATAAEAVARVVAGEERSGVASGLGVTRGTVNQWCRAAGVDPPEPAPPRPCTNAACDRTMRVLDRCMRCYAHHRRHGLEWPLMPDGSIAAGHYRPTSNPCRTCEHDDCDEIDTLLLAGIGPGPLSRRFGLSYHSLLLHYRRHVLSEGYQARRAAYAVARLDAVKREWG